MDLEHHYEQMYQQAKPELQAGRVVIDPWLGQAGDDRYGLTILLRLTQEVEDKVQAALDEFRAIEPGQYYYPASDLHVTVLSVVSCQSGYVLPEGLVHRYVEVVKQALQGVPPFSLSFRGLTASPEAIMVRGYMEDDTLNKVRTSLRQMLLKSGLPQTMDKRYVLQTAHATVLRFAKPLLQGQRLVAMLEQFGDYEFGRARMAELELVYNDWYQRRAKVMTLARFPLG